MDSNHPIEYLRRNPLTQQRHRRELFWQVTLPLSLAGLVLLALAVLSGLASSAQASVWADISLIWLIIPMLALCLFAFLGVVSLAYGVIRLIAVLPYYAQKIQDFFRLVSVRVAHLCDLLSKPVLRVQSLNASVRRLGRAMRRK